MLLDFDSIKNLVAKAEVITFDVFDTLLIRPLFLNPDDLFYFLARNKGLNDAEALNFKKSRITAEALAREVCKIKKSHTEVHISNIYDNISDSWGITWQDELDFEIAHLRPRTKVFEVYELARKLGKSVYAISDIYFSAAELEYILSCNQIEMDGIYSSADARCGKYECKLFEMFLCENKLKAGAVLHIGDNEHSDYISAMQAGIVSVNIPKVTSRLFRDSSYNLNALHSMRIAHDAGGNFFGSLVSYLAYQREIRDELSSAQRFGIKYAVPLLYLFCRWLINQANKDGVKTLYLMARDGYAISDVLKKIAPNFDFRILNISRRAILFPAATENKIIWERFFVSASQKPIINILSDLRLEARNQILDLLPKKGNEKFSELSASVQLGFLGKSYQLALPQMRQEHADYKKYAKDIGLLSSDVAVVDVGWALSSHEALELVIGHKVHGYYVGKLNNAYSHENIKSFLFESFEKESTQWGHIFSGGVELLELPFVASEDQVVRIVDNEFERRQGFVMDEVRSMVSNEIRSEVVKFLDFTSDLCFSEIKDADAKKYLMEIFSALVINPVPNEYFNLGALPHDRYVAGSGVETIATHWMLPGRTVSVGSDRSLWTIVNTVIRNVRNYGLRVTMKKIHRKIVG